MVYSHRLKDSRPSGWIWSLEDACSRLLENLVAFVDVYAPLPVFINFDSRSVPAFEFHDFQADSKFTYFAMSIYLTLFLISASN